jgi:hypothetical protein
MPYIIKSIESGMNQVLSKPIPVDCLRQLLLKLDYISLEQLGNKN